MKNEHIISLLDESAFAQLSERDLTIIKSHVADCENCRRSYQAASVSAVLLKIGATQICEPSPFFETKLLAAWREKQIKSAAAFWRWWQASSTVVSVMIITVATLAVITLFAPNAPLNVPAQISLIEDYSTEKVIFGDTGLNSQLTTNQALEIIYDQQKSK